jgi:hypothetical protein
MVMLSLLIDMARPLMTLMRSRRPAATGPTPLVRQFNAVRRLLRERPELRRNR